MTIPKAQQNAEMQRKSLSAMNALFVQLQTKYPQIDTLSMGMSNDMQLAIECGSTMVRIGSAIFGSRQ